MQRASPPAAYDAHDVKHLLVQFDSQRLRHQNAEWKGTRYVVVFFNKDVNYRDAPVDRRTVRLKRQAQTPRPLCTLSVRDTALAREARAALVRTLDATHFPEDRTTSTRPHSKYGDQRGTFLSFGVSQSRKPRATRRAQGLLTRKSANQNNRKYAEVYAALGRYMDAFAPGVFGTTSASKYQTCIVAKDSRCEWHCDSGNIGPGAITGLGAYTGGALLVERE